MQPVKPSSSQRRHLRDIRDIVESAYDHGAEMIVAPCQLCQANVEVYQSEINKKQGTKLNMPVVYYSQPMIVACGAASRKPAWTARHPAEKTAGDRSQGREEIKMPGPWPRHA
jgi:heterodisulfide reductase subunit B